MGTAQFLQLLQVCYDVEDEKIRAREIRALLYGAKDLGCADLLVITGNYEDEETVEWFGIKGKIRSFSRANRQPGMKCTYSW